MSNWITVDNQLQTTRITVLDQDKFEIKAAKNNQNTYLMLNTFLWKLYHLWPNYKEYDTSRKARDINYLCIGFCGVA